MMQSIRRFLKGQTAPVLADLQLSPRSVNCLMRAGIQTTKQLRKYNREQLLKLTRGLAIGFGALQVGIGIWATTFDATVVSNALTIAGYSAGLLLGMFSLGVMSQRVTQASALSGALYGLIVHLSVQFLLPQMTTNQIRVAWPWYALLGCTTTIAIGFICSLVSLRWAGRKSS